MADWLKPLLTSLYNVFVDEVKDRDVDAATMFLAAPTNPPNGAVRFNRATNILEQYSTGTGLWTALVLDVAGGGTAGITAIAARAALGLGSMAVQQANNVAITGGTVAGVLGDAAIVNTGQIPLARGGTGQSLALGSSGKVLQSNGANVIFGSDGSALINLDGTKVNQPVPWAKVDKTGSLAGDIGDVIGGTLSVFDGSGATLAISNFGVNIFSAVGKLITLFINIQYPVTASAVPAQLTFLGVSSPIPYAPLPGTYFAGTMGYNSYGSPDIFVVLDSVGGLRFANSGGGFLLNSQLSGKALNFSLAYLGS